MILKSSQYKASSLKSPAVAVLILLLSRVIGVGRDVLISITYGFSKVSDLFFQTTFFPAYILNIYNGPFTTAFVSSLNHESKPDRARYVLRYRRMSISAGVFLSLSYFVGATFFAFLNGRIEAGDILLTCAILTPSCISMAVLGYGVAVANAFGMVARAVTLLTISNVIFVLGVLLIWFGGKPEEIWLLQAVFTISSAAASIVAWISINTIVFESWRPASSPFEISESTVPLQGFQRALWLALLESAAFIFTQVAVLAMASHEGIGWASAVTLAQRICFSALSLVVMPTSSRLTIAVINERKAPARLFGIAALAAFVASGLAAFVLAILGPLATDWAIQHGRIDAVAGAQIGQLIPAFSIWMIAMALNGIVSRMLFGLRLGGIYVTATIIGYTVANVVRVFATVSRDFPTAVAWGALVELITVAALSAYVYIILRRESGA